VPRPDPAPSDPLRLLRLLWTPEAKVGRRGTTLSGVVSAAVELADSDGLDAVTMRAGADRVGVGAMTLYGYVPGKPELVELMLDTAVASTYAGVPAPADLPDWRTALTHIAERNVAHTLAHGWMVEAPPARPILGPGHITKYEMELAPLDGIGLDDHEMDHALTHVLALAQQSARWRLSMERTRTASGLSDDEWWATVGPTFGELVSGMDIPVSSRVGTSLASAGDPDALWRRGLEAVIQDVERRIATPPRHEQR